MDATGTVHQVSMHSVGGQVIWTKVRDPLVYPSGWPRDRVAGMILAGYTFMDIITPGVKFNSFFHIQANNRIKPEFIFSLTDLSLDYRERRERDERIPHYAFRLKTADVPKVYFFDTPAFIDGFADVALGYKVEMREYILPPLNHDGVECEIPGQNLAGFFNRGTAVEPILPNEPTRYAFNDLERRLFVNDMDESYALDPRRYEDVNGEGEEVPTDRHANDNDRYYDR